jgi:hypothetical protein
MPEMDDEPEERDERMDGLLADLDSQKARFALLEKELTGAEKMIVAEMRETVLALIADLAEVTFDSLEELSGDVDLLLEAADAEAPVGESGESQLTAEDGKEFQEIFALMLTMLGTSAEEVEKGSGNSTPIRALMSRVAECLGRAREITMVEEEPETDEAEQSTPPTQMPS